MYLDLLPSGRGVAFYATGMKSALLWRFESSQVRFDIAGGKTCGVSSFNPIHGKLENPHEIFERLIFFWAGKPAMWCQQPKSNEKIVGEPMDETITIRWTDYSD